MEDKVCGNCVHYHPKDKDRLKGECHLNPPVVLMTGSVGQYVRSYWATVDGLDWCSQFLSRENYYQDKGQEI